MKKCSYCGKEYPDEAYVCVIDQEVLIDTGPAVSNDQSFTLIFCPSCGKSADIKPVVAAKGSFSTPVFLAGGLIALIFQNVGRERRFRCNTCGVHFGIRTRLSKAAKVLFWISIIPAIMITLLFVIFLGRCLFVK